MEKGNISIQPLKRRGNFVKIAYMQHELPGPPEAIMVEFPPSRRNRLLVESLPKGPPLSPDQILPQIEALIDGRIINWRGKNVLLQLNREVAKPSSGFAQILRAMVIPHSGSGEAKEGFQQLARDLKSYSPQLFLSQPQRIGEWFAKLQMGGFIADLVAGASSLREGRVAAVAKPYLEAVEDQIAALKKIEKDLNPSHLEVALRLADCWNELAEIPKSSSQEGRDRERDRFLKETGVEPIFTAVKKEIAEENKRLADHLWETSLIIWEKLRRNWGWPQIQKAISLLPALRSPTTLRQTIAALEANLTTQAPLPGKKEAVELDPEGLLLLLKFRWGNQLLSPSDWNLLKNDCPQLSQEGETALAFQEFSVPRKYLPSALILLLNQVAKTESPKDFLERLAKIHRSAAEDREATTLWLLTLLLLRQDNPQVKTLFEKILPSWGNLQKSIREILLNQRPGKLWLEPKSSRIEVTDPEITLKSAFPLYTSTQPVEVVETVFISPPTFPITTKETTPPVKREACRVAVDKRVRLPLFGEVGLVKDEMATGLVGAIFENHHKPWDADQLLANFGQLASQWIKEHGSEERLYLPELNKPDPFLKEAQTLGLEAIEMKGRTVIFILDQKLAIAESLETLPIGIEGKLDAGGQLQIAGMEDSFLGEPPQLWLNNLALHLATQPLLHQTGQSQRSDKELIRQVNAVAASWNRSPWRGSRPKIGLQGENSCLAVRVPGSSEIILVGELVK